MKTFIIDLHGRIDGLDPVLPIFYPFLADCSFVIIPFYERDNRFFAQLSKARSEIRTELKRSGLPEWQAIFIIDLSRNTIGVESSLCQGGLSEHLAIIKTHLINPLENDLQVVPCRQIVLSLDSIDRTHQGEPVQKENLPKWWIDTKGFLDIDSTDDESYYFTSGEIQSLNSLWPSDIDFGKVNQDQTLGSLPDNELKETIYSGWKSFRNGFKVLIDSKKELLANYIESEYETINKRNLDLINNLFEQELAKLENKSIEVFLKFSPSIFLQTLMKEHFSSFSFHHESFTCLRVEFPSNQKKKNNPKEFTFALARVAFLAIILVDPCFPPLSRDQHWLVSRISDDQEVMSAVLSHYVNNLSAYKAFLDQKKMEPVKVTVALKTRGCVTPETLPRANIIAFTSFTPEGWLVWRNRVKQSLDDQIKKTEALSEKYKIQCFSKTQISTAPEEVDLCLKIEELNSIRNELTNTLNEKHIEEFDPNWLQRIHETSQGMLSCLHAVPNLLHVSGAIFFAFLVFFLPFFLNQNAAVTFKDFLSFYYSVPLLGMLAVCIFVALYVLVLNRWRITTLAKKARFLGENIASEIVLNEGSLHSHIRKLCELGIVVKNIRILISAKNQLISYRRETDSLVKEIDRHLDLARAMGGCASSSRLASVEGISFSGGEHAFPCKNKNLWFCNSCSTREVVVKIGIVEKQIDSKYCFALEEVTIERDHVFANGKDK